MTPAEHLARAEASPWRNAAGALLFGGSGLLVLTLATDRITGWQVPALLAFAALALCLLAAACIAAAPLRKTILLVALALAITLVCKGMATAPLHGLLVKAPTLLDWSGYSLSALLLCLWYATTIQSSGYALPHLKRWATTVYWLIVFTLLMRLALRLTLDGRVALREWLYLTLFLPLLGMALLQSKAAIVVVMVMVLAFAGGLLWLAHVLGSFWPLLAGFHAGIFGWFSLCLWGLMVERLVCRIYGLTPEPPAPLPAPAVAARLASDEAQEGADKYTRE